MHPRAQYRSAYNKAPEWMSDRIDVLKYLRQGDGLTVERVSALEDDQLRALYPSDEYLKPPEAVYNLIRWAALSLVDDQYSLAIRNALGIGDDVAKGNLTDRRERFYKTRGITLRTLINHEDAGIELLAQQIDITASKQDLGTVDVAEVATSVEKLRSRLDQAERENRLLRLLLILVGDVTDRDWRATFWLYEKFVDHMDEIFEMDEDERGQWYENLAEGFKERTEEAGIALTRDILRPVVSPNIAINSADDLERVFESMPEFHRTNIAAELDHLRERVGDLHMKMRELGALSRFDEEIKSITQAIGDADTPHTIWFSLERLWKRFEELKETVERHYNVSNANAKLLYEAVEREKAQAARLDAIEKNITALREAVFPKPSESFFKDMRGDNYFPGIDDLNGFGSSG